MRTWVFFCSQDPVTSLAFHHRACCLSARSPSQENPRSLLANQTWWFVIQGDREILSQKTKMLKYGEIPSALSSGIQNHTTRMCTCACAYTHDHKHTHTHTHITHMHHRWVNIRKVLERCEKCRANPHLLFLPIFSLHEIIHQKTEADERSWQKNYRELQIY